MAVGGGGRVARDALRRHLAVRQAPLRPRRRRSGQEGDAKPQHPQGDTISYVTSTIFDHLQNIYRVTYQIYNMFNTTKRLSSQPGRQ